MTTRLGRADLHIHTLASDGTSGIVEILDHVERETDLDVVAITDHERIDAALAARVMARDRGLRAEVIVGEEVSTLGGHLLGLFLEERVRPLRSMRTTIAEIHEQGGLAIPAHPLVPYPLCAQGWLLRRLISDRDPRVRPDAIEAFNPTTLGRPWHSRVVNFAAEHGLATVGNSDAHEAAAIGVGWTTFPGRTADDLRAAILERHVTPPRQLPRHGPGPDVRPPAPEVRPRRGGGRPGPGPPRRLRARPRLSRRPPSTAAVRGGVGGPAGPRGAPIVKIGLVSPYVYPLPGGVTQHVRYLYENLRLRGHDVRILTSSHGLQRASEGDIIRIGKGFSLPVNGSVGTITLSPRFVSQVRATLEREQFDLLHFHEPFVPFLSTILLRLSTSVNIATFHAYGGFSPSYEFGSKVMKGEAARLHGRIAVSGAAKHFIDRYFPGEYKVIPNGVDVDRFQRAVPIARWQDGTRNLLFVGRHEPRKGLLELLKAYRILRKTGCDCRLLVVGTGPLGREARRYVATRRLQGVEFLGPDQRRREGPALPDRRRLRLARDRWRIVRDRPARGDGGRHADRRLRHPRLQGRRPAWAGSAPRPAARAEGDRRRRRAPPPGRRASGRDGSGRPREGPGIQLGAGDPQGRRLLRGRHPSARRAR